MTSPADTGRVNVGLLGATGRMGRETATILNAHTDALLAAVGAGNQHPRLGQPYEKTDLRLRSDAAVAGASEVVIDFSMPAAVSDHLAVCLKQKIPYVCGVTGLEESQQRQIHSAAQEIPVLWAPNMSIGVTVTMAAAESIANRLKRQFKVSITDIHHAGKKDAPSGTALEFGRLITKASAEAPDIEYHSVREGQHPGEHLVEFEADGELISVRHRADSRLEFAQGAVTAAIWLQRQPPGLYNMRDLLGIC